MTIWIDSDEKRLLVRAIDEAWDKGRITLELGKREAAGLRLRFYGLRRQAQRHAEAGDPHAAETWRKANDMEWLIVEDTLIIRRKTDSPGMVKLAALFGESPQQTAQAEAEASAQRLLQELEKTEEAAHRSTPYYKREE